MFSRVTWGLSTDVVYDPFSLIFPVQNIVPHSVKTPHKYSSYLTSPNNVYLKSNKPTTLEKKYNF